MRKEDLNIIYYNVFDDCLEKSSPESIERIKNEIVICENQLRSLYAGRQRCGLVDFDEAFAKIRELVFALIDNKIERDDKVSSVQLELLQLKEKARELGAALFEAALFSSSTNHN